MRKTHIVALLIIALIGVWLWSGDLVIGGQGENAEANATTAETSTSADADLNEQTRPQVVVRSIAASERQSTISARGRTEADQRVDVRAQIDGLIERVAVTKGQDIKAGDLLCRIETAARKATVAQTEAQLAQASLDYEAAVKLNKKGYSADARVRALKAARDAAEANRAAAAWVLERTEIRAPIDGRIEALPPEIGTFLRAGDICATVMNADPMLVVINISERQIGVIAPGMPVMVALVDGTMATGEVSFVAATANNATRTFRVDVTLPNANGTIREGMTADVSIPLAPTMAHLVPSSILVLADDGAVGVRAVDDSNTVSFIPITLLGDGDGGVWVKGLPDQVRIIVTGQEYVKSGVKVMPVLDATIANEGATS